jgi:5-methylcytosine-specific restriction endonuclease McrA
MTLSPYIRRKLEQRDTYCLHCGESDGLVIHHRKNRGMGGSKLLDVYENLIRVCSEYNSRMESDSPVADQAREHGHKLESWQDVSEPVFDRCDGEWYELKPDGTKEKVWKTTSLF